MSLLDTLNKTSAAPDGWKTIFDLMAEADQKLSLTSARQVIRQAIKDGKVEQAKFRSTHKGKLRILTHYKEVKKK